MTINNKKFDVLNAGPREWYSEWMRSVFKPINRAESWATELGNQPQPLTLEWCNIFCVPYKTTRETELQSFAFKLAYRLVPCNKYLQKIRIKSTDICSFCTEIDTISHVLYKCRLTRAFWDRLSSLCESYCSLTQLGEVELLLGVVRKKTNSESVGVRVTG